MLLRDDKNFKYRFIGSGYSDDCGHLDGAHYPSGNEVDESMMCHNWFELKINGEVVGECMMNYDSGWQFRFRSNTHKMEAGKILKDYCGLPAEEPTE